MKTLDFILWSLCPCIHCILSFLLQMLKMSSKEKYPLFTFVRGHSRDYDFTSTTANEEDLFSEDEKKRLKRFSTEDFVLL